MEENLAPKTEPGEFVQKSRLKRRILLPLMIFFVTGMLVLLVVLFLPTRQFPANTIITIKTGTTLSSLSREFKEKNIVNSSTIFHTLVKLFGNDRAIESGDYLFDHSLGVYEVARRIAKGEHGIATVRVTIPEGMNTHEISNVLKNKLPFFDDVLFLKLASLQEGYLFPDTYFFNSTVSPQEVISRMEDNFKEKTRKLESESKKTNHSFKDIIIMASILEKEVKTIESRIIVSGILWRRLSIGMPLQVDATLGYVTGKGSDTLTLDDLNMQSPYNTYKNKGLPIGPIGNPGLEAIDAALHFKASPYLYYLSDKEGVIHYAVTFEEHKANRMKYLKP